MGKFDNKIVWITGASSGIGAALAKEFIKSGAEVVLSARRENKLKALSDELGRKAHVFTLDVQKKADVDALACNIRHRFGRLDVVVANAGYSVFDLVENITEHMWRNLFDTNVFGAIWTVQAAIPFLKETKGRIAIMSSVAAKLSLPKTAAYSASKSALLGFANSLFVELYKSGVSVTTMVPGQIESEITMVDNMGKFSEDYKRPGWDKRYFQWPSDKAAQKMLKAIYDRKREIVITGHGKLAAFFGAHLSSLTYWSLAKSDNRS